MNVGYTITNSFLLTNGLLLSVCYVARDKKNTFKNVWNLFIFFLFSFTHVYVIDNVRHGSNLTECDFVSVREKGKGEFTR